MLGENMNVSCSLVARLVSRLWGPARCIGLTMTDDALRPRSTLPETDGADVAASDSEGHPRRAHAGRPTIANEAAICAVLDKLESKPGPAVTTRKGTVLRDFFRTDTYYGRPG